jgi:hypothetical protein
MKKSKKKGKSAPKKARRKTAVSQHPYQHHIDKIRDVVHASLASAGITGLALRSMQFSSSGCPEGEHSEKVCTTQADGTEICTWQCVPN